MKTRTLISVIVVIFALGIFNNTIMAQKKSVITNTVTSESGVIKTYLILDSYTKKPVSKKVYNRDNEDNIKDIVNYTWNGKTGWQYENKIVYVYSESNKLISVTSTNWDKDINEWSNASKCMVYHYKGEKNLVDIKLYNIDKTKDILLTELVK